MPGSHQKYLVDTAGVGLHDRVAATVTLIAMWAAYIVRCVLDGTLVRKAQYDTFSCMFWAVIFVPVYLYKQAKKLQQSKGYFFRWLTTTTLSVVFAAALPTAPLAVRLTEVKTKAEPAAVGTQIVTSPAPSQNLSALAAVLTPFKAKALAYARDVARQESCDLNEHDLAAISGKLSGIDGEIVVAAFTLEGCGGSNYWGQQLVVLNVSNGAARKLASTGGPSFEMLRIADGQLSADVTSYAPGDGRCCPSLKANKSFSIVGQKLVVNN